MRAQTFQLGTIYMPAANGGTEPAPYLLDKAEATRFLRIDDLGVDVDVTLARYRGLGLKGVRIGRTIKYALPDLIEFIRTKVDRDAD